MHHRTIRTAAGFVLVLAIMIVTPFCSVDPYPVTPESGYPTKVGEIFLGKCATSGCHNKQSYHACAGLNLSSWTELFKGGNANSSVIPYRPDQSFLFFAVNTFSDMGPSLLPTMPLGHDPLSREEVLTIRDWIANGAPDHDGNIAFSGDDERSKVYVANQGCDFVTVFDAKTQLVMRCIDVGVSSLIETPHDIMVSPDGEYWYVTFFTGRYLQKYRTADDVLVGQVDLGIAGWHSMNISNDSRYAALSKWEASGRVAYVDLNTMTVVAMWNGFSYPHGCSFDAQDENLYVVSQQGNFIYKISLANLVNVDFDMIPLHTGEIPSNSGIDKPYVLSFCPGHSKYYVTCQGANEIRAFNAANDSLLAVIPASGVPQLIVFSETTPYAFISSMLDTSNTNTVTSVDIINWNTDVYVNTVYPGFQERGIAVDDANKVVYVGNRNINPGGPAPHHTTSCAGRNGSVALIDLETLEVRPGWKTEVGVDPYCITIRK